MLPLSIPELHSPFPSRVHPDAQNSFAATRQWVRSFNLHEGAAYEIYESEGLSWMTARFYPTAPLKQLLIADKFNTLLFAVDDLMDHNVVKSSVVNSREKFRAFIKQCLQVLDQAHEITTGTGHLAALADVWAEVVALSTPQWRQRFIAGIRAMFDAALWADDNMATGRLPSVEEFYQRRPFLGAANTSTDMIGFVEGVQLPDELLQHPTVTELTRLCQITVCLANDLFSLSKEMLHSDKHNMVTILMHERKLTLNQAVHATVTMHDVDVSRFIRLSENLPTSGEYQPLLNHYVKCLTALMRGNIDWSIGETNRYKFVYKENGELHPVQKSRSVSAR